MSLPQPIPREHPLSFTDSHTVETPEQIQLQFPLAGVGSRFLALAIDTLIQAAAAALVGLLAFFLGLTGILRGWQVASLWLGALAIAFFFLLNFGYFALFEILWNGQTPGKRAIRIRVIKDNGRPLTPPESLGRNLLRIVDQMPGFYAVGILVAMCNRQSKRLGDFVAGSIVVLEKSLDSSEQSWSIAPVSSASHLGANRLTAEELALLDAFLHRRNDLHPTVRYSMAQQVLSRLESKLTLTEEDRIRVETTLESLAHEQRSH